MQFSIISVCWNDLEGLKLTHQSLYSQTYTDFEWIVVDGNSTDGTVDWLKQLKFDNLFWTSEPDNGIFDAMNKGIDAAKGDYLLFLNSFDELAADNILEMIHNLADKSENKLGFIYGDSIDVTSSGTPLYRKAKHHKTLWRGLFTQHQSMFFENNPEITYKDSYKLTADYAYIGNYIKNLQDSNIAYIETPICKFKLGGTNETARFRALKEDFQIRKREFRLNIFSCYILYYMHYMHTIVKRFLPFVARSLRYNKK